MVRIFFMTALLSLVVTSCATVTTPRPIRGEAYTGIEGPNHALKAKGKSTKEGRSCAHNVLRMAAWGDASIYTAKQNGQISEISSVSYENFYIVPYYSIYMKTCTIVSGT